MLLKSSSCLLAGLFSLISLSPALPLLPYPRYAQPEPLLTPRASYSVVPVDGGSPAATAGGSPGAITTVIETVTQPEAPQTTMTVVSTDIVPAGTATITSTAIVTGQDTIEISVVTVTPAAATVTVTAAGQQTITILPTTTIEFASITSSTPFITSDSMYISTSATAAPWSASSTTYDDGFWHTTYPVWSNSSSATTSASKLLPSTSLA